MFVYKSKPRFHRFYEQNQVGNLLFGLKQSLQAVYDYIKILSKIFDFITLISFSVNLRVGTDKLFNAFHLLIMYQC